MPHSPTQTLFKKVGKSQPPPRTQKSLKRKRNPDTWENGEPCSNCGEAINPTMPAKAFLGDNFASWQDVLNTPQVARLCEACAWCFRSKELLYSPSVVNGDDAQLITWKEAATLLLEPLPHNRAVILPASGRKTVAPYAQYGKVALDSGNIVWSEKYRLALLACHKLNRLGIRGSLLKEPAPPLGKTITLSMKEKEAAYSMWEYLKFVRSDKTLLPTYMKLSMNLKGEK